MIAPHGGKLINRTLNPEESSAILENIRFLKSLVLNKEQIKDVKNIGRGLFSPLKGFLRQSDFKSVVSEMRLANGIVWPIPVILDINDYDFQRIKNERNLLLVNCDRKPIAILKDIEIYAYDKNFFAENVFGTLDKNHPSVYGIGVMGGYLVGGEIGLLDNSRDVFPEYNFFPSETRAIFDRRKWKTISSFQTRNVPHRGHEFLQKTAMEKTDGLFIQPIIGDKKIKDFKDEYILSSYEILINRYYPKNRVLLGILPLKMRYAGPREAVFHAIIRKNFGCTHFIIGRDHAGVRGYYEPFAAQNIFNQFNKQEIGIEILKYPEVVFCVSTSKLSFIKDCPNTEGNRVSFSGTKIREYVAKKESPPNYLMREEVFSIISQSYNSLVDDMYKKQEKKQGFVLWFTGLCSSGKTTIADGVYNALKVKNIPLERLDGDIVRQSLSRGLGFTRQDRSENIKRVAFVAKLLSRNGTGVIASFVSPYKEDRDNVRREIANFIEVYANSPLEVCEKRDIKGLYKKARNNEIKNFTGISDRYDVPENPEIELDTANETKENNIKKVLNYLKKNGYI